MGKLGKTIDELYSRTQIRDLTAIKNTNFHFDWQYCPIVFSFMDGFQTISCTKGDETMIHIMAMYMKTLWEEALKRTLNTFPKFLNFEWKREGYFNMVRYTHESHKDGLTAMWNNLQALADSGEIQVNESLVIDEKNNATIVCKSFGSFATRGNHSSEKLRSYKCSDKAFSYKWKEISKYFMELSENEVTILQGKNMNPYDPKDQGLIKACINRDFDAVKKEVENGADVNGFDEYGESPIIKLLDENTIYESLEKLDKLDPDYTDNIIKILDYLISKGADINLYCNDAWGDALTCVHFSGNLRLMRYLCEHGIRKDLNCFISGLDDIRQWHIHNAAFDYIENDICIGDYDSENVREQEKILLEYGITDDIEGFNNESIDAYYDSLPNVYAENPEEKYEKKEPPLPYSLSLPKMIAPKRKELNFSPKPFDPEEHRKLINILAEAWKNLDATELVKYIHQAFQYDSQWVFESMFADQYPSYIKGKFAKIKETGSVVKVEIIPDNVFSGEMISLNQDDKNKSVLRIKCTDGLIYKMDMCMF